MKPYYDSGGIQIYHGDCREILPELSDQSVDLVLTDPPYFLPIQSYVGTRDKGYVKRMLGDTSILKTCFDVIFGEIDRLTKPTSTYYVFCDGQSYPIFYQVMFPLCKHVRPLVWDKVVSYNGYTWRHQHELIAWGEKDETQRVPTGDGDVLRCRGVLQKNRFHPAEKPIELLTQLAGKHERGLILDPYMGSGSSLVAAKQLGYPAVGIEIEEQYCEVAAKRLQGLIVPHMVSAQGVLFMEVVNE